jgi:hypothetical protein
MKNIKPISIIIIACFFFSFYSCKSEKTNEEYFKKVQLKNETIAVGIYKSKELEAVNIENIAEAIKIDAGMVFVKLSDADILKTKLENVDILIIPDVKSFNESGDVDNELTDVIRNFVITAGKGILAFGDGGKMIGCSKNKSLNLVDIKYVSERNLNTGLINFNITSKGESMFPELIGFNDLFTYYNGYSEFEFVEDSEKQKVIAQVEQGESKTPIVIETECGKGKVLFISAQFEATPGMRWMIPRMLRYVHGSPNGSYGSNIVRPDLYTDEVIVNAETNPKIERIKKVLAEGSKKEILKAIDELNNYDPWSLAENLLPFLIGRNDELKLRAAKFFVDNEYTMAIDDFETAIKTERNKKNKVVLEEYKIALERMVEQN